MDRFLFCENVNKQGRPVYILQTVDVEMLIQVIDITTSDWSEHATIEDVFDLFEYKNERHMFLLVRVYHMSEDEVMADMQRIRKHIRKAWNWYKAYLIWMDEQIDQQGFQDPEMN